MIWPARTSRTAPDSHTPSSRVKGALGASAKRNPADAIKTAQASRAGPRHGSFMLKEYALTLLQACARRINETPKGILAKESRCRSLAKTRRSIVLIDRDGIDKS